MAEEVKQDYIQRRNAEEELVGMADVLRFISKMYVIDDKEERNEHYVL